jgi:hypothetical protein
MKRLGYFRRPDSTTRPPGWRTDVTISLNCRREAKINIQPQAEVANQRYDPDLRTCGVNHLLSIKHQSISRKGGPFPHIKRQSRRHGGAHCGFSLTERTHVWPAKLNAFGGFAPGGRAAFRIWSCL